MLLNPVGKAQRSQTKSESRCYQVVITSVLTNCYPTSRSKLNFSIFTNSALWAELVSKLRCVFIYLYIYMSPSHAIFTESALRPIQSISRDVRMFVSLSLCPSLCPSHPRNHASRRIRDLWSKGVSLILAYL